MHGAFSQLMDTHLYSLKAVFHYCICFASIIKIGKSAKENVWSGSENESYGFARQ